MAEKPQAGGAALQVVAYGERLTGWFVIAHHSRHMSCTVRPIISTYQLTAWGHIQRLSRPHVFWRFTALRKLSDPALCQDHICQRNGVPQCKPVILGLPSYMRSSQTANHNESSRERARGTLWHVGKGGEKERKKKKKIKKVSSEREAWLVIQDGRYCTML